MYLFSFRHKEAAAVLKSVMAVLRAKQKEVEAIEEMLAKMLDELRVCIHTRSLLNYIFGVVEMFSISIQILLKNFSNKYILLHNTIFTN